MSLRTYKNDSVSSAGHRTQPCCVVHHITPFATTSSRGWSDPSCVSFNTPRHVPQSRAVCELSVLFLAAFGVERVILCSLGGSGLRRGASSLHCQPLRMPYLFCVGERGQGEDLHVSEVRLAAPGPIQVQYFGVNCFPSGGACMKIQYQLG